LFSWRSLGRRGPNVSAGIHRLQFQYLTTSGRAALALALRSLELPFGAAVLVPTYHCPTMIAPAFTLGFAPRFYPINAEGLPGLAKIDLDTSPRPMAIIVPHLFDRARSLRMVRNWCDRHRIALVEDCAHAPLGSAGERASGHWGDLAAASITKFAAVPEMGLLAAPTPVVRGSTLERPSLRDQLKAAWNVLERAAPHDRPAGLHHLVSWMDKHRGMSKKTTDSAQAMQAGTSAAAIAACDMGRTQRRPTWVARLLAAEYCTEAAAIARRINHSALLGALKGTVGVQPLFGPCPQDAAPYAVPLWVDNADVIYAALRSAGEAVYRWDRVWPGTPTIEGDYAVEWRVHVLQCLCHQSLTPADMQRLGRRIAALVSTVSIAGAS